MALVTSSESIGRQLYGQNEHLRNVANFMEHPETRQIYQQYFEKYEDIICFTMFLKLYEEAEKVNPEFTPYQKIVAVKQLIDNGSHRQKSVRAIREWFQIERHKIKNQ